jgi:hypothetical protein
VTESQNEEINEENRDYRRGLCFDRATRRDVLGVKVKYNPLALELIQRHLCPLLAGEVKTGA